MARKKRRGRKAGPGSSGFTLDTGVSPGDDNIGCFQGGTEIIMGDGIKSIQDVKMGDKVVSKNLKTDRAETAVVYEVYAHEANKDGLIINGLIKTTTNHPFYLEGEWVTAGELELGDKILHLDGELHTIHSLELDDTPYTVYNFEVTNTHNYYADGYLVHNTNKHNDPLKPDDNVPQARRQDSNTALGGDNNPDAQWKEYKKSSNPLASDSLIGVAGPGPTTIGKGTRKPPTGAGALLQKASSSAKSAPPPPPPPPKKK